MPVLQLDLDSSKAVKGLKEYDRAVARSGTNTDTAFTRMRNSANMYGAIAVAAMAAAGAAITAFSLKAVTMASSVVEAQGVFDQAFEGMTETAEEWARVLGEAYHLSELKAKESLNTFQLVLRGMGLATESAGKMSFSLVKVAADLGAAFDKNTTDVVYDIRSALAGSTEVMSKYGIVVKQTQIVNEALRLGLIATKGEIDETSRAQALFSLIMKKSQPIIGTTAREAEGYAGQLKEAEKNVGDLTAALGKQLLPIFTKVLTAFNNWISATGRMEKIVNASIEAVRFLVNGYLGLEIALKSLIVVVASFAQGLVKLLTPLSKLLDALEYFNIIDTNPIDQLKLAVDNFAASAVEGVSNTVDKIIEMNEAFDDAKIKTDTVTESVEKLNEEVSDLGSVAEPAVGKVKAEMDNGTEAVKELQGETKKLVIDIEAVSDSVAATGKAFSSAAEAGSEFSSSVSSGSNKGKTYTFSGYDLSSNEDYFKAFEANTEMGKIALGSNEVIFPYLKTSSKQSLQKSTNDANRRLEQQFYESGGTSQEWAAGTWGSGLEEIKNTTSSITNVFNQQLSRSDITSIIEEMTRTEERT